MSAMDQGIVLITLGGLFLAGLAADAVGRHTPLPRVTLLLGCGIVVGGSGLDLLPQEAERLYDVLSTVALTMVAFLLGNSLTLKTLRRHGGAILTVSILIVLGTVALVAVGLWLVGVPAPVALLLGAIATATDPAATQDALRQAGARGSFPKLLRGIVAIDDAWGVLAFSIAAVFAAGLGGPMEVAHLTDALWEIGGAIMLGAGVGLPAAYLTGRLARGEPQLSEALGLVFLTAGIAVWAGFSYLIAGMLAGAIVANLAHHHERAFHEIEHVQWPFLILFFVLAGASLDVGMLADLGLVGGAYVLLRILARVGAGWLGGTMAGLPAAQRPWIGAALLPQAGVAVGMALIAAQEFPEHRDLILSLTIGTTVIFEILGPIAVLWSVRRVQASRE
ncbi:cation:proton antiporter [Roseovarius sp. D22-M7]|uniref:cation:proton antiporter n=1 Tax=Roseovarius sp. D22-M7 TaxID=3127116 RepID=UPI0030102DBE